MQLYAAFGMSEYAHVLYCSSLAARCVMISMCNRVRILVPACFFSADHLLSEPKKGQENLKCAALPVISVD